MGFFGKKVDKVSSEIRENTTAVDSHLKKIHSNSASYDNFTFEYLYTSSEPISQFGDYGSVIYMRVDSPVHQPVYSLPVDSQAIQHAIDKHQKTYNALPTNLSKDKTRWIYFNMGTVFRAC
jgi:hypothetical protein